MTKTNAKPKNIFNNRLIDFDRDDSVDIEFEEAIPVAINGEMMPLIDLVAKANEIAGNNAKNCQ